MVEMKDGDNRGQGSRSDNAVTKSVRWSDLHWRLERLDAIHRQLLTGLAAVGEIYRLQDVWTTYSGLLRHERPDAPERISAAELLAELKPSAPTGNRDDVLEFGHALRLLKGLRTEIEAAMRSPLTSERSTSTPVTTPGCSSPTITFL
jgi:hypothetical protein